MDPIERMLFAVSAAQSLVERTAALIETARLISTKARTARLRSAALRLLAQRQRARPPV
ncbi:MAG TPA: hypothetical protein VKE95_07645 [Burkholderiales bacterium]|nr:hypothetical protein [Burkholderiales bacterium]